MRKDRSVHGTLVYKINGLSCQIVHTICVDILFLKNDLRRRFFHVQNGLEHDACAVLDKLSHGVEICCKVNGCRENTSLVFSFALTEELFPPLRYIMKARLVVCYDLHLFSFS